MPVVDPNRVVFSSKTRLKIGDYGTARASLAFIGLLGKDIPFNAQQTTREKLDGYPETIAAQGIKAQSASIDVTLREWKQDTIRFALGLNTADLTITPGGDVVVAAENGQLKGDVGATQYPRKLSVAPVVKNAAGTVTYVANTDYRLIDRDLEGRTLIVRITGGAMVADQAFQVGYTYTLTGQVESYPIGKNVPIRYRSVELTEDMTDGGQRRVYIPKASIVVRGAMSFFSDDAGGDTPITINAIQDPAFAYLALLENQLPS